jgi:hypothetical protein
LDGGSASPREGRRNPGGELLLEIEARVREVERSLEAMVRTSDVVMRLRTIPGVGSMNRSCSRATPSE